MYILKKNNETILISNKNQGLTVPNHSSGATRTNLH